MRIEKVKIDGFKNLIQFNIELDKDAVHTVLIGQNAAGKSNFLEALVIIFRDLDLAEKKTIIPDFDFEIEYKCKIYSIKVIGVCPKEKIITAKSGEHSLENIKGSVEFFVDGEKVTKAAFYRKKSDYLPRYVFSYYSGISNRLVEHFDTHQKHFRDELLKGNEKPLRPLFYARLIHSHFVLLAFFGFGKKNIDEFLKEYLGILGLESILFVLKKPNWPGDKEIGDAKFWYAKGVVKDFLNDLWDASLGPIPFEDNIRVDFDKNLKQEQLFLYVSNQEKLEKLAQKYGTNTNFFKMLESTYLSDLIQEVRVRVKKENIKGNITFKELSEGEQQLITVLGLIRFTKEDESLFLLDEPDTHLNPLWKWKYMSLLEKIIGKEENSQIIMTTHDPLVIGGLVKEEIRIFFKDKTDKVIKALEPNFDPKGLGVAGILTSEFFNLPSTLDYDTELEVIKQYELVAKKNTTGLTQKEEKILLDLNKYLDEIGYNFKSIDPLYDKFLVAITKETDFKLRATTPEEKKIQENLVLKVLKEISEKK